MARAGLRWSVRDLAEKAQTAVSTINRFEVGRATPHPRTLAAVREVMEEAGARFDGSATVTVIEPPASAGIEGGQ